MIGQATEYMQVRDRIAQKMMQRFDTITVPR